MFLTLNNCPNIFSEKDQIQSSPSTSSTSGRDKRALDVDESCPGGRIEPGISSASGNADVMDSTDHNERLNPAQDSPHQQVSAALNPIDLNFPLGDEKGPACLVKVFQSTKFTQEWIKFIICRQVCIF